MTDIASAPFWAALLRFKRPSPQTGRPAPEKTAPDKWVAAVLRLTALTRVGKVRWRTGDDGQSYVSEFGTHGLTLSREDDYWHALTVTSHETGCSFRWPPVREVVQLAIEVRAQVWEQSGIEEWLDALEREATK